MALPNRHVWLNALKIGVSVGFLWFIISKIDVQSTIKIVAGVNPILLLLGGVLFVSVVAFDAARLILFFRSGTSENPQNNLTWSGIVRVSKVNLASLAVANIGFGTVGSEMFKVAAFRQHFGSYMAAAGAIVGVRLVAVCVTASLCAAAFTAVMLSDDSNLQPLIDKLKIYDFVNVWTLLLVVVAGCAGFFLFLRSSVARQHLGRALAPFRQRSFQQYIELLSLSTLIEFIRLSSLIVFVTAFGVSLPFWLLLLISTVSTLLILLPISWNGLGIREASVAGLLTAFGVDWEIASAIAITSRIVMIVMSLTGVVFLSKAATGESL